MTSFVCVCVLLYLAIRKYKGVFIPGLSSWFLVKKKPASWISMISFYVCLDSSMEDRSEWGVQ